MFIVKGTFFQTFSLFYQKDKQYLIKKLNKTINIKERALISC